MRVERGARLGRLVGSKPFGAAFSGDDFTSSTLTPTVFIRSPKIRILKQHADRADQRRLLRDDLVGGERRDVAARGRETFDDDDHRLLRLQPR